MNERAKAIGNLAVDAVLLLNLILTSLGKNPIPFDQEAVYMFASYAVLGLWNLWIWWKNQNMTVEAQTAQKYMQLWKNDKDEAGGEGDPLEDPENDELLGPEDDEYVSELEKELGYDR